MTAITPERGRLTDVLVAELEAAVDVGEPLEGVLVGDHFDPPGSGWTNLEPGERTFVASVVLSTQPAEQLQTNDIRNSGTTWRMRYGLRSTGGARSQCDAAADRARAVVLALDLAPMTMGGRSWTVQQIFFPQLGAIRPVRSTDVPSYVIDDRFEVWLAASRG